MILDCRLMFESADEMRDLATEARFLQMV